MPERFGIYYAPATDDPLWDRAARWLGRDALSADGAAPHPVRGIAPERLWSVTEAARRYGFHATIKPPMALAPGKARAELEVALADFAASERVVDMGEMELVSLDGFLALVPRQQTARLTEFAARCVETFEPFRAALSAEDRARRMLQGLSPRQQDYLNRYGYPHVMNEFRLHLTLTDRLDPARHEEIAAAAAEWFAPFLGRTMHLDRLVLFHESEPRAPFIRGPQYLLRRD